MQAPSNILELRNITISFPGVIALDNVDLDVVQGEVHVLVGENGAGKSSLIKLLCGVYFPDQGEISFAGAPYTPRSPLDAIRSGIHAVYQEFNLLSYLSVAENIFFERLPRRGGLVDYKALYRDTAAILDTIGLRISPRIPVELLGVAQMQLVEIAKALSSESKVLILDEPTAALGVKQAGTVLRYIAQARARNLGVIFITHNPHHAYTVGDRFTILKRGRTLGTFTKEELPREEMVRMMSGQDELEALTHELEEFKHSDDVKASGKSTEIDQQLSGGRLGGS